VVIQNCVITGPPYDAVCTTGVSWDPGGCYYADCPTQTYSIEPILGVAPNSNVDTSMQAYPNPASGSLIVTSANSGEKIQLLDVLGRVVMSGVIPANGSLALDVSSLSAGTYYVSSDHTEVKFIKN